MLLAALAGCGAPSGGDRSITVVATEMQFSPQTISATQGEFVTIKMENKGKLGHNLVLDLATGSRTMAAEPGSTGNTTFPVPETGRFRFYCSLPGHEAMVGELVVSAP